MCNYVSIPLLLYIKNLQLIYVIIYFISTNYISSLKHTLFWEVDIIAKKLNFKSTTVYTILSWIWIRAVVEFWRCVLLNILNRAESTLIKLPLKQISFTLQTNIFRRSNTFCSNQSNIFDFTFSILKGLTFDLTRPLSIIILFFTF